MLIVVIKNVDNPNLMKYKARLVTVGCDIKDIDDKKLIERLRHLVPASLASVRLCCGWATLCRDGVTLSMDAPGAYVQADTSGPPVFMEVEEDGRPGRWTKR